MGKSRVIENDFIANKFIKVNGYIGYIEVQNEQRCWEGLL